ncbi:DUF2254 domain-containing protein [Salinithrix halophila]|uniref:DUF2254 domain-containing protein n=1 Tax=Salinithrix halophila TaxID=1485204 RepID=A0ABV8JFQ1_9BACL
MKFWIGLRQKFWFLPILFSLLALLAAYLTVELDRILTLEQKRMWFFQALLTDIDLAKIILSSLAVAIFTMITITFSSIMVVLTTYTAQYSPRTLQNFISNRITQRVLGVFVAGFIYTLFILLFLNRTQAKVLLITPTFAVNIAIACLAFFVYFIHHVASWIQVNNLISQLTERTLHSMASHFDTVLGEESPPENMDLLFHKTDLQPVTAQDSGYIQYIDVAGMIRTAARDDAVILMEKSVGDFVTKGAKIFSYRRFSEREVKAQEFLDLIVLGNERTAVQDIEFGLHQLVEIALRAVSPGINDPHTAVNCINRIGTILTTLSRYSINRPYHYGRDRQLRLILRLQSFSYYVYKSFYQIRHYASGDLTVMEGIITALQMIAEAGPPHNKETIWDFSRYITEGINTSDLMDWDKYYLNQRLRHLAVTTGFETAYRPLK